MSYPRQADLAALITQLVEAGVELIVVGGAAAVIHGAPTTTIDLDIVPRLTADNLGRLHGVLTRLEARVRQMGGDGPPIALPVLADLRGQLQLSTAFGPLDCLARLHDGRGYDELLERSEVVTDGHVELRVIDLQALIDIKASTGRARDKLLVPLLMAVLDERAGRPRCDDDASA